MNLPKKFNAKHARFVAEYLIDHNATQAALRAGYSPKTAYAQGAALLKHPEVNRAIALGKQKQLDDAGLTAAEVMGHITAVIRADVRGMFDEQTNLKPIAQLDDHQAKLVAAFEVVKKNAEAGDGKIDVVHKVKLVDRAKFVEMAAKHFALLTDVVKVTTDETRVKRLLAGRQRAAKK